MRKIRRKASAWRFAMLEEKLSVLFGAKTQAGNESDIASIRKAAEQGEAESQYNLGHMCYRGEGVAQDYKQAAEWFRRAAEQGDAGAEINLGYMYYNGQGVPLDDNQALKWFRKAAEQGIVMAQVNLGYMCYKGQGGHQDYKQAVVWYRKAAEQGEAMAQVNLGFMFYKGQGVSQDYTQAVTWYRKAAEQGEPKAQYNLGVMYGKGEGVPQNYNQAVEWFNKAAGQGCAMAQYYLGVAYSRGRGVPQNFVKAYAWSSLAAASKLTPEQHSQAQSLAAELQSKIDRKMKGKPSALPFLPPSSQSSAELSPPPMRSIAKPKGAPNITARQKSRYLTKSAPIASWIPRPLSLTSVKNGLMRLARRCNILYRLGNELGSS